MAPEGVYLSGMAAVDLRARTRAARPPLPATGTSLAVAAPGYEAAVECDRLIRAIDGAGFEESYAAALRYADQHGQGFPLIDRLIGAVVQAPLRSKLDEGSLLQTAARRMFTWLDVESDTCPHVAWTENGKYHVVDPGRTTHTLCNRQIIERPYYKLEMTPWNVGVKRGVWQIALAQGSACVRCAGNEKTGQIPMLAEPTEFDVLDSFSVEFLTGEAAEKTADELVKMRDELWGGGAVARVVHRSVRETVFRYLTETVVSRALARLADLPSWIGHEWIRPNEPGYQKRELIWQIEAWTPDPNAMSEAIHVAGWDELFREGPAVREKELEEWWVGQVGLQLVRRCWPSFAWE